MRARRNINRKRQSFRIYLPTSRDLRQTCPGSSHGNVTLKNHYFLKGLKGWKREEEQEKSKGRENFDRRNKTGGREKKNFEQKAQENEIIRHASKQAVIIRSANVNWPNVLINNWWSVSDILLGQTSERSGSTRRVVLFCLYAFWLVVCQKLQRFTCVAVKTGKNSGGKLTRCLFSLLPPSRSPPPPPPRSRSSLTRL